MLSGPIFGFSGQVPKKIGPQEHIGVADQKTLTIVEKKLFNLVDPGKPRAQSSRAVRRAEGAASHSGAREERGARPSAGEPASTTPPRSASRAFS